MPPNPGTPRRQLGPNVLPATPAADPLPLAPSEETRPCPGCGHPRPMGAEICIHCGLARAGDQLETAKRPPKVVKPPEMLPDTRFQRWQSDAADDRARMARALMMVAIGLTCTIGLKALVEQSQIAVLHYLIRYCITLAAAWVIVGGSLLTFAGGTGTPLLAAVQVAGALALCDMVQNPISYLPIPAIPWIVFLLLFAALLYELLDVDLVDAILMTLILLAVRIALRLTLFWDMQ